MIFFVNILNVVEGIEDEFMNIIVLLGVEIYVYVFVIREVEVEKKLNLDNFV